MPLPGGSGTMKRTVLCGQVCAVRWPRAHAAAITSCRGNGTRAAVDDTRAWSSRSGSLKAYRDASDRVKRERQSSSSGSIASGGTTEPVMMISPARSRSPKAASTSATWRTMSIHSPVLACGSVVRANSAPRRMMRQVRPSAALPARAGVRRRRAPRGADRCCRLRIALRSPRAARADRRARSPGEMPAMAAAAVSRSRRPQRRGRYAPRSPARPPASPSRRTRRCRPDAMRAFCVRKPTSGPLILNRFEHAPARRSRPSSRAACRRPSRRLRRSSSCAVMPRTMRGSSQQIAVDLEVGTVLGQSASACDSPDRPRSRNPRSSPRPSSPTPARRPRSTCC